MKLSYSLIALTLCLGTSSLAQDYSVNFLKGKRQFEVNAKTFDSETISNAEIWQSKFYRYLQFNSIPTDVEKQAIEASGIELLEYIPNYTYVASLPTDITASELTQLNIRSIESIDENYKIGQRIQDEDYPEWSITKFGTVLLSISLYDDVNFESAMSALESEGIAARELLQHANMAFVSVSKDKIATLVAQPYVKYVDIMPDPGTPESDDGRNLHRSNALDGEYFGSRQYDGTGITVAVNDDGFVAFVGFAIT